MKLWIQYWCSNICLIQNLAPCSKLYLEITWIALFFTVTTPTLDGSDFSHLIEPTEPAEAKPCLMGRETDAKNRKTTVISYSNFQQFDLFASSRGSDDRVRMKRPLAVPPAAWLRCWRTDQPVKTTGTVCAPSVLLRAMNCCSSTTLVNRCTAMKHLWSPRRPLGSVKVSSWVSRTWMMKGL